MVTEAKHTKKCCWNKDPKSCNCGLNDLVYYWQITPQGDIKVYITVEEAINKQIYFALTQSQYIYESQNEALQDFFDINNAFASRMTNK